MNNIGSLVLDGAHIKKQDMNVDIFAGIVQLPNDRQLNIEVHQAIGDTKLAEKIFKME